MAGCSIEKYPQGKARAVMQHNLRLGKHHSNPHIDASRRCLNRVYTVDGENPVERFERLTGEARAHKPRGRREGKSMVEMVSAVYDLPLDFPHPDDPAEIDRFFLACMRIQASMSGGWDNQVYGVKHMDELHEYTVSASVLAAEGTPVQPGDPPVRRMSRIHCHAAFVPVLTPEQITEINGVKPRSRSRKGHGPSGRWFAANQLLTRGWYRELNRRVQRMALKEFHCHYEARHGYSSSAEVEQLKLESAVAEQAEPLVARAREQARAAGEDRRKASETLDMARQRDAESAATRRELDDREAGLERREASFAERVRVWEQKVKIEFVDRLKAWLERELAKARETFARARREGYEAGRAEGYRAGVGQGARALDAAPQMPAAGSVSGEQLRAVEALRRQLDGGDGAPPASGRARHAYTAAEWAALPPTRRAVLVSRGVQPPQAYREADHGRTL
ncbi:plasmid recombination protein [Bifidobacterium sp. ESL0764]|uniref:plasmid recombination protein n=1 Tax=Bifidobacterium sp. ESL0764 TaxID=2983228 RepID=UPI0023F8538D|nr:plasmid recombination protein [Bifidobacterium sp. ESL0764]WEV65610.1 plasmid recombination protein [Bifidobacterium sp. ESL0764]